MVTREPKRRRKNRDAPRVRLEMVVSPEWLAQLDRARVISDLSRSAYIRQAVHAAVKQDLGVEERG
jgi:hypothetical protein